MPGICGIVSRNEPSAISGPIEEMVAALKFESWHRAELQVGEDAGFALGRVTLGYVNTAPQPVTAQQGRWLAVMDGELYDLAATRQRSGLEPVPGGQDSHAEVLLAAWLRDGERALEALQGSFVAAIYDTDSRRLWLMNDRFGTRPVYYARPPGRFAFSSGLRSLLADPTIPRKVCPAGLALFFNFGHYLRDLTSVDGVRVLNAGSVLEVDAQGQIEQRSYLRRGDPSTAGGANVADWWEALDAAAVGSVRRCTEGTSHLGLALSGGLDARTILGLVDHEQVKLQTLCLGMPGSLDHRAAEELARLVGCEHHSHVLGTGFLSRFREHLERMVQLTDGQYLSQCIVMPTFPLYRELGIRVLLRGHAGELMHMQKAYNYSLDAEALQLSSETALEQWLERRLRAYMLEGVEGSLFAPQFAEAMREAPRAALRADLAEVGSIEPPVQRIWRLFVSQRLRRETVLSLQKFRSVVEPRLPLLDGRLVDLLWAAPPERKVGESIQSYLLQRHRPEFLRVVNANTGTRVGAGPWRRRLATLRLRVLAKLGVPGYQPYERLGLWLRRELADTVREILLDERCLQRGVYSPDTVRRVVADHLGQRKNHTFLLLGLMIFELGQRHLLAEKPHAVELATCST